ncbi:MAG: hypothetical protein WKF68_11965 [Daejeonella sp.]
MITKSIIENLKEASNISATELINAYVEHEETILTDINSIKGIKSEFYCDNLEKASETSKFLSIYADFTSVFMLPNATEKHLMHYYPPEDPRFIKRDITFPAHFLNGYVPKPQDILPAYTTHTDTNTKKLMDELDPFINSGRLMIRPIRSIMLYNVPNRKQDAIIYYASSDTPNNNWKIKESNEKDSFIIDNGLGNLKSKQLYEITLPFINNISTTMLNSILDDETDLLSSFRVTLKDLLNSPLDSEISDTSQIYNDKLRPELESINRKFKTIQGIHKIGVGASLAAVTISLIAVNIDMATNFQTIFNTFAGTSTLGFLASEIKYRTDEDKLNDNPYFLLWRINKENSASFFNNL